MAYATIRDAWLAGREYAKSLIADGRDPIKDNTFAAACFNDNNLSDLDLSDKTDWHGGDEADCATWNLTRDEWAEEIGIAYEAKRAIANGEL